MIKYVILLKMFARNKINLDTFRMIFKGVIVYSHKEFLQLQEK